MSFYLRFTWDSQLPFLRAKIQLKKACWIPLFDSILAEVKFPVILIIKINKECVVKHVENLRTPPRGGVPPWLRTTELNHLLTMFTQKFYVAIKGFRFHFARGIVYGEESSKSS